MCIEEIVQRAVRKQLSTCALTDFQSLSGAWDFHAQMLEAGLKPILGCSFWVQCLKRGITPPAPMVGLAKNATGFRQLLLLLNELNRQEPGKQSLKPEEVVEAGPDILWLMPYQLGEGSQLLDKQQYAAAQEVLHWYRKELDGRFYLELCFAPGDVSTSPESVMLRQLMKMGREAGIPCVDGEPVLYGAEASAIYAMVLAFARGTSADHFFYRQLFQRQKNHLVLFRGKQEQIYCNRLSWPEKTQREESVSVQVETKRLTEQIEIFELPSENGFPATGQECVTTTSEEESLRGFRQKLQGLAKARYGNWSYQLEHRLEEELDWIQKHRWIPHLLLLEELHEAARQKNIQIGPGKGRSGNSLVAYLLGITSIDPVKHALPSYWFRSSALPPSLLSIEVEPGGRTKLRDWLRERFGKDRVGLLTTTDPLNIRLAWEGCFKYIGMDKGKKQYFMQLSQYYKDSQEGPHRSAARRQFWKWLQRGPGNREEDLDLNPQHRAHAAPARFVPHPTAVVIANKPLKEHLPVVPSKKGFDRITLSEEAVERSGCMLLHLLEWKPLQEVALLSISWNQLPLNDAATLEIFREGKTDKLVNFEAKGMQKLLRKFQPERFEDLVLLNAVFRPGLLKLIPSMLQQRNEEEKPADTTKQAYLLKETYGELVYQEQLLDLAMQLGGFSTGDAALLLRELQKKRPDTPMLNKFLERVFPPHKRQWWRLMLKERGALLQNKAHFVGMTMVAFAQAYRQT